jgi:hypothetical protein
MKKKEKFKFFKSYFNYAWELRGICGLLCVIISTTTLIISMSHIKNNTFLEYAGMVFLTVASYPMLIIVISIVMLIFLSLAEFLRNGFKALDD